MHRALGISEVIQNVVQHCYHEDPKHYERHLFAGHLFRLLTVNRMFSEYALDQLWENARVATLVRIMPSAVKVISDLKLSYAESLHCRIRAQIVSLTLEHHYPHPLHILGRRFFFYSKRAKTLSFVPMCRDQSRWKQSTTNFTIVDQTITSLWQDYSLELFPRLRGLELDFHYTSHSQCASMLQFLTPRISELKLELSGIETARLDDGFASGLTQICIRSGRGSWGAENEASIYRLICGSQRLRAVDVWGPLDEQTFQHLAGCPDIRELKLLSSKPVASIITEGFPSLESLLLEEYVKKAEMLPQFLERLPSRRFTKLSFSFGSIFYGTEEETEDENVEVDGGENPEALWAIKLGVWTSISQRLSPHVWLTHLTLSVTDDLRDDLNYYREGISASWAFFEPLLVLSALEEVDIHLNVGLALSPGHLMNLASHWPRLRRWTVLNGWYADTADSAPFGAPLETLFGILLACRFVSEVPITVSSWDPPSDDLIQQMESRKHPFTNMMSASVGDAPAVARVLQRTLPNLEMVRYNRLPEDPVPREMGHASVYRLYSLLFCA